MVQKIENMFRLLDGVSMCTYELLKNFAFIESADKVPLSLTNGGYVSLQRTCWLVVALSFLIRICTTSKFNLVQTGVIFTQFMPCKIR